MAPKLCEVGRMWVLMLQDTLSKSSTTANMNSEASQILTQALHLVCVSDLRCKLSSIQFYWEQLIKVEGKTPRSQGKAPGQTLTLVPGTQLAKTWTLELSSCPPQLISRFQLLPLQPHGCPAKPFLKASGHSKPGLVKADHTCIPPAVLGSCTSPAAAFVTTIHPLQGLSPLGQVPLVPL